jgi:hypothetical protein
MSRNVPQPAEVVDLSADDPPVAAAISVYNNVSGRAQQAQHSQFRLKKNIEAGGQ